MSRAGRVAVILTHPAPYREPVARSLSLKAEVDEFCLLGTDANHPWAGFGGGGECLQGRFMSARLLLRFVLGGRYRLTIYPAYAPFCLTIAVLASAILGRRYGLCLDTVRDSCGRIGRALKAFMFRRADFLWVPGEATRRYLREGYGIENGKIAGGLYIVDKSAVVGRPTDRGAVSARRFLMVGNDVPVRSMDAMVEGFRAFAAGRDGVELTLCGKGAARFAGGCVRAVEGVSWSGLGGLYDAADVYVHSGAEQFSTAVQIAAMRGMPVVCSRGVGIAADMDFGFAVDDWREASAWERMFRRVAEASADELAADGRRNLGRADRFDAEKTAEDIARRIDEQASCSSRGG